MGKGTDRRAALIPKEYETKLWKYDVKFHGTVQKVSGQPEPPPGPLVRLQGPGVTCLKIFICCLECLPKTKQKQKPEAKAGEVDQALVFLGNAWER